MGAVLLLGYRINEGYRIYQDKLLTPVAALDTRGDAS